MTSPQHLDVVVVGGGIAGLTAAPALHAASTVSALLPAAAGAPAHPS